MTASIFEMTQEDGQDYEPRFENEDSGDEDSVELGCIATFLTENSEQEQCDAADYLFKAIQDKGLEDLFALNARESRELRMAALVSMPNSGTVRLVYGLEIGMDSVLTKKSTAKKLLAMIGEGSHATATPSGIILEPTVVQVQKKVKAVSDKSFMEKQVDILAAGIQQNQSDAEVDVMMVAPVPAYLASDAVEKAVPAGRVLERIGEHHESTKDYMKHLKDFLLAALVLHNKQSPKNELEQRTFFDCMGDSHLALWSKRHFSALIPPPVPAIPAPQIQVVQQQAPASQLATQTAPSVGTGTTSKTKWSDRKINYLLQLCAKQPSPVRATNWAMLPAWMTEVAEESDSHQQLSIVREQLKDNKVYQVDTANNPDLLDYIRKMQFAGIDGAEHPTLRNACKQLSPYLCSTLTDTELSSMIAIREAIESANYVTVQDNERLASKAVPTTPGTYQDFVDMLKKFANTLFALFGANCALYDNVKMLITGIEAINQGARPMVFTHNNKATILWLTFLQTRQFTNDPSKSVKAFEIKLEEITNKVRLSEYLEMPQSLLSTSVPTNKGEKDSKRSGDSPPGSPKKSLKQISVNRDERLKVIDDAIAAAVQGTKLRFVAPGLICKKCDTTMNDLIGNPEMCGNFKVLGKCSQPSCFKKHEDATADEVTRYLTKLKPFLDEPTMVARTKRKPVPSFYNNVQVPWKKLKAVHATSTEQPVLIPPDTDCSVLSNIVSSSMEKCPITKKEVESELKRIVKEEAAIPTDVQGIKEDIGKTNVSLMRPSGPALDHPASDMLLDYADNGCPVDCGENWSQDHIEAALLRGPHISAKSDEAITILREETDSKVKPGFARVVRYGDIRDLLPPSLKISPIAGVPHKSRRFRWILDLSFQLLWNGKKLPSVNSATSVQSKHQSMTQLGQVLKRLIAVMADARKKDADATFRFAKLDIKDGFWRLGVSNEDAWNFCYVLPSLTEVDNIDDVEIVVPNSLQMGWCESPPLFCSASETGRDVIAELLKQDSLPEHKFENQMFDDTYADVISPEKLVNLIEVFVDDYIAVSNAPTKAQLLHISRAMLHGIHSIFPPPDITGHEGEDPIAQKKMLEGEGLWQDCKEILGWIFDGKAYTISLPDKKIAKIISEINKFKKIAKRKHKRQQRIPLNKWQKMAGSLMHASFGLVGGKAMFSPIWKAMGGSPKFIQFNPALIECLKDWKYILKNMMKNPTDISLLVAEYPHYTAYLDACGLGAGGVLLSGSLDFPPIVWQIEWPTEIKELFKKHEITINDLELAAIVLAWLSFENILTDMSDIRIGLSCDNTSAVAWNQKGSSASSKVAGRLLRMLYLRVRDRGAERILAAVPLTDRMDITRDVVSAWRAASCGVTTQTEKNRKKFFGHWVDYCTKLQMDPLLRQHSDSEICIATMAFAARVRKGSYGYGATVKVGQVSKALAAISKTIELAGATSPIYLEKGVFKTPIARMLEGYRREDPPVVPQLAVPVEVPHAAFRTAYATSCKIEKAKADLALIAFYYLLRVGEYTKPKYTTVNGIRRRTTRTKQFSIGNIGFFKGDTLIRVVDDEGKLLLSLEQLLEATAATLKITNQKNGRMGETIHHECTGHDTSPVKALARRVYQILVDGGSKDSLLCDYLDTASEQWSSIKADQIRQVVKTTVTKLDLKAQGITADLVGSHSLRSGGAMALKLHGIDDITIKKMGRWSSLTFTMYIHTQIAHLSAGISSAMSTPLPYVNIAAVGIGHA